MSSSIQIDNPDYDLQTIIVSKDIAKTRPSAKKKAERHRRRAIYTSRETSQSYRFRQRPPRDFVAGTFRTKKIEPGISLVFGRLKRGLRPQGVRKNPGVGFSRLEKMFARESGQEVAAEALMMNPLAVSDYRGEIANKEGSVWLPDVIDMWNVLPDPGMCSWLGESLEYKWVRPGNRYGDASEVLWDPPEKSYWYFLWSPSLRAVISLPKRKQKKQKGVANGSSRSIFERFTDRGAANTYQIDIPRHNLVKCGKAIHFVYRSDKWNPGKEVDYIHHFDEGVRLWSDNPEDPSIFVCQGGRMTVTERGLIY